MTVPDERHLTEELFLQLVGPLLVRFWVHSQMTNVSTLEHHLQAMRIRSPIHASLALLVNMYVRPHRLLHRVVSCLQLPIGKIAEPSDMLAPTEAASLSRKVIKW